MDNFKLLELAEKAKENAYVPYSKFKVGAALLTKSGKVYTGCNVEVASFGATNCAERTAIFTGLNDGAKKIKALAVVGDLENFTYPCGICRQVMVEFMEDENMDVIIIKNEKEYIIKKIKELLPGAFTKKDLEENNV